MTGKERWPENLERLKAVRNIRRNCATYLGFVVLGRIREIPGSREIAPEPFDFFMHNGNILSSMNASLAASAVVALHYHLQHKPERRLTPHIWGASLIAGVAVNALVETRTGLNLPLTPRPFVNSTPDPIDALYGMVGAAIGAGIAASTQPKSEADLSVQGAE